MGRRIPDSIYENWFNIIRDFNEQGIFDFGAINARLDGDKWTETLGNRFDFWIVRYADGRKKRIENGEELPQEIIAVLDAFIDAYIWDYFADKGELDVKQEINDYWSEWKALDSGLVFSYLIDNSDDVRCGFAFCKVLEDRKKLKNGFNVRSHAPYMLLREQSTKG